jgi:hypothetical protein
MLRDEHPLGEDFFRVNGEALLDDVKRFIQRFVKLSEAQATAATVYVAHTHCWQGTTEFTPYLAITSAEKQSGKSKLMDVLVLLVAKPCKLDRASVAAIYRIVELERPTILLDETDATFNGKSDYSEALRGILDGGFGCAIVCVGKGSEQTPKKFSTFCPKVFAGLRKLPDTIADRSIPIRMQRKLRSEAIERFRTRDVKPAALELKTRLEKWADQAVNRLATAKPNFVDELSDRQNDVCEPLLAIAEIAGGGWPVKLRDSLVKLCNDQSHNDESVGILALRDIREIFESSDADRIASAELVQKLADVERSPWAEFRRTGKPITKAQLASILDRCGINPTVLRNGPAVFRGYDRYIFSDAWDRYLPRPASPLQEAASFVTTLHSTNQRGLETKNATDLEDVTVAGRKGAEECNGVTDLPPFPRMVRDPCWHCGGSGRCDCSSCGSNRAGAWGPGPCVPCKTRTAKAHEGQQTADGQQTYVLTAL